MEMDEERLNALKELEEILGYRFSQMEWLHQALIHKSYAYETHSVEKINNEVLEFLGDAVLNLAVGHLLYQRFPGLQEGTLSLIRSYLVQKSFLASLSQRFQLERYLLVGKSRRKDGEKGKTSLLANTYEAMIGAIFLDSNFDQASKIIRQHFEPYLQAEFVPERINNPKTLLQLYAQQIYRESPRYQVHHESKVDHERRFKASVSINGEIQGWGWGRNKKEAEQEAAKEALKNLHMD